MKTIFNFLIAFAVITLGAIFSSMSPEAIKIIASVLGIPALMAFTWWLAEKETKKRDEILKNRFTNKMSPVNKLKHPADQRYYAKKKEMVLEEA